ncbi:MAG TPA: tail fiber protein [Thermoanaerobaculia bacterium]|jgi:microcystin-dependent protein
MAQPYIGEIRMFGGSFAPAGWAFCAGQQLPISQNDALYTLIGTTYGGDGQETFNLPDIQGRLPMHMGNGPDGVAYPLAQEAGVEEVTLTTQQIPLHNHALLGSTSPATETQPSAHVVATSGLVSYLTIAQASVAMNANSITPVGGSQPHTNMQPYLCITFIISLFGIFPSQT